MWFTASDMKDAYFHVDIHPPYRKFLHFMVDQEHYQFLILPFGLVTVPRGFMNIFAVVVAQVRCQGYTIFPYLDGWFLVGQSHQEIISTTVFL